MLEKDIEKRLVRSIKKIGGLCLKFESPGYTGVPDRMILLPGGNIKFVELKAPGKKERSRQKYVQKIIKDFGFDVYSTIDSEDDLEMIVKNCQKSIIESKEM